MEPQEITLNELKQIVRRRIWSLILPMLLFSLTGVAVALALPSIYNEATWCGPGSPAKRSGSI